MSFSHSNKINHYKDDKDKPLGHFLDVGENKKLTKHFEQVEMKSGKLDKSMSASQKEASTGSVYVEEKDGKTLVHFEPSPKCKIPGGKWPKILKALKAMLGGLKAIAVIGGQVVQDDEETGETTTDETTTEESGVETGTDENTGLEEEEETGEEGTSDVDTETLERNRRSRGDSLKKMEGNIKTMENAVGKVSRPKLNGNIAKYEEALKKLIEQANADGTVDDQEQAQIDSVKEQLELLKQNVEENGSRLQTEHHESMRDNLATDQEKIDEMLAEMGI